MDFGPFKKFDLKAARSLLPTRKNADHKATAGHALVLAGSRGMYGAAVLAATAASRAGAGYVHVMTNGRRFPIAQKPDFLVTEFSTSLLKRKISAGVFDAVAVGPGLSLNPQASRIIQQLRKLQPDFVVVDADALSLLAKDVAPRLPETWVMTPHEGELARLLKTNAASIHQNRREAVSKACEISGCVVLLKGHRTLIACPDGRRFEIQSGNAALAKAGTGDVLTGLITGFLAQRLTTVDATCLAAFLHGQVADDWLKSRRDILSLMASDILVELPRTLRRVRGVRKS